MSIIENIRGFSDARLVEYIATLSDAELSAEHVFDVLCERYLTTQTAADAKYWQRKKLEKDLESVKKTLCELLDARSAIRKAMERAIRP